MKLRWLKPNRKIVKISLGYFRGVHLEHSSQDYSDTRRTDYEPKRLSNRRSVGLGQLNSVDTSKHVCERYNLSSSSQHQLRHSHFVIVDNRDIKCEAQAQLTPASVVPIYDSKVKDYVNQNLIKDFNAKHVPKDNTNLRGSHQRHRLSVTRR